MVGTITPVVYGSCRGPSWPWLMGIYAVAQIAGAALTGLVLGGFGALTRTLLPWETTDLLIPLSVVGAVGALHDLKLLPFRLPSRSQQVPQSWKRFSSAIMAASYGFGIGMGVLTRIPFASFYLVLLACAGLASLPLSVGLMALYGATRAGTVAATGRRRAQRSSCARVWATM